MKRIKILLTLIALAVLSAAVFTACKSSRDRNNLRVLYWNIQNGMWSCQDSNYQAFVDWVKEKDPDICIFAEASTIYYDGTSQSRPMEDRYLPEHWGELAARYGHSYWFKGGQRDNYPQVITSKYPIDSISAFVGSEPDSVVCHGSGWARIQINGLKPLNLVSIHLKPFPYGFRIPKEEQQASAARHEGDKYRCKEVEYVVRHTVKTSAHPEEELWLMAGDFNSKSRKDNFHYGYPEDTTAFLVHDFLGGEESPYYDIVAETFPGEFRSSHGKDVRIDYVYVTKALLDARKEVYTQTDEYTTAVRSEPVNWFWIPSDHYPIIVDFDRRKMR
ncbi:MAG: endonuclease [Bacteroidales bacterium]|nr:endonuclease [Bacteroidales bacterium]